jgi:hypothetical protein
MRKEKNTKREGKKWVLHDNFLFSNPPPSLSLSQKVSAYKNRIESESTTTKSIRLSSARLVYIESESETGNC